MTGGKVLVLGGGITGLAAAAALTDRDGYEVELWEADARLGGKIATSPFGGLQHVDEGADAYLTRVPHAVAFAAKVGLGADDLTAPTEASALVWHDAMHPIPGGIVLGVPASVRPFVTTSLLSWRGKLRAAAEPLLPRTDPADSLGRLIRARFGDEVHDRLVDALIGSIYATDTDRSSLAAVPQLAQLASRHRSLLIGARRQRTSAGTSIAAGPIFNAPLQGMQSLVDAAARYVTAGGGRVVTGRSATTIEGDGDAWRVDDERFDAIVLAVPATRAALLLRSAAPDAAQRLSAFEHADVIMVRMAIDSDRLPAETVDGHSGYLVPKSRQRRVTAVSFGSQKWAHWQPADGTQILRVSLGRDGLPVAGLDDGAVTDAVLSELALHLGAPFEPRQTSITRWDGAFPQYRPYHAGRVAAVEADLPQRMVLAGASYRGIGIPACIADGERAAGRVIDGCGR
jgi:oxygen-dependent protoporphyrinogen oxidase